MKQLVYDTETTGFPDFKKAANDPCQPHIVQISALLIDDANVEVCRMNVLIKPDGWTMPAVIEELTGITQAMLEEHGVPIAEAINMFLALWRQCERTIAHNDNFDRRVFRTEMARVFGNVPLLEEWKQFPAFCTMQRATEICNLPPTEKMVRAGFTKPKAPKLEEAYLHFHGCKPVKMHDAMADVESTLAIYLKLMESAK